MPARRLANVTSQRPTVFLEGAGRIHADFVKSNPWIQWHLVHPACHEQISMSPITDDCTATANGDGSDGS